MNLKNKAIALFACLALCTSFVPVLAIADPMDDEVIEADGVELTAQAEGIHVVINKSTAGPDENGKFTFANGSAVATYNGAVFTDEEVGNAGTGGVVSITPTPEEGYNAFVTVNGDKVPVAADTTYTYTIPDTVAANSVINIDVDFEKPGVEPSESAKKREVTVTVDNASLPLLSSDKVFFKIGSGDGNDVEFQQNGQTVVVTNDEEHPDVLLSFAIDNRYFIPTAVVNGAAYETFDTGLHDTDHDNFVVIGVELTGEAAKVDAYNINLTIGARAQVDSSAQSINEASANYMLVEDGRALVSDVANTEIDLAINDAAVDFAVDGAVATFDIDAQVNGQAATATEAPLNITMGLDTSVYTASDYVVVRNHEGTITELDTTYDAATGRLSFVSDQFSDYSLVDKGAASANTKATSQTKLAATGDPLTAGSMVVISIAAFVAAVFATCKLREQQ